MGEKFSDNSCKISKRQSSEFRVNLAVLETRILGLVQADYADDADLIYRNKDLRILGFRGLLFYKWRLLKRVMESPSE